MEITKQDVDDATGTPEETAVRLSWTLQCYARMEMRQAELIAERARLRDAVQAAIGYIGADEDDDGNAWRLCEELREALGTGETAPSSKICRECHGLGGAEVRGGPGPCDRCGRVGADDPA